VAETAGKLAGKVPLAQGRDGAGMAQCGPGGEQGKKNTKEQTHMGSRLPTIMSAKGTKRQYNFIQTAWVSGG
jgi:hypothetical protein